MPKCCWNVCVVLVACLMFVSAGCAKPATGPGTGTTTGGSGTQAGSTTGGGAEVPMPAATEEKPAEPTPVVEPTPAEPAPAAAEEKKAE